MPERIEQRKLNILLIGDLQAHSSHLGVNQADKLALEAAAQMQPHLLPVRVKLRPKVLQVRRQLAPNAVEHGFDIGVDDIWEGAFGLVDRLPYQLVVLLGNVHETWVVHNVYNYNNGHSLGLSLMVGARPAAS